MAAEAVDDLGYLRCFSLNKNCLFKLEVSMWSGSVTVNYPLGNLLFLSSSPVQSEIIAKFFINSHPMAPLPTKNILQC